MSLDYELYKEGGILNDRYQKIEDISEGSYGYVSLAKDIQKKKLVAVKYIYKLEKEETEDRVEQDEQDEQDEEASRASSTTSSCEKRNKMAKHRKLGISSEVKSRLSENICFESAYEIEIQTKIGNNHNNIVKLLDFFDSYIILEYCSGGDLYEAIKNDLIPRKTKQITHILTQTIDAIQYVHSKGIYHRDIKPENILISNLFDWTIKLSDWGLATCNRKSLDRNVGSERYMAPELFESNLDIEERKEPYQCDKVDVWSIGIVFLNIVFCKNPFSVANQSDKSFCYFAANREALFDVFSTMSLDFFQVLRHSLTIDPTNRDLEKMRLELNNVSEYTLDDEYYNSLPDDEVAISDEETHPVPAYIPPSSAPAPVSLPTPVSSSIGNTTKRLQPSDSNTPKSSVEESKVTPPDRSSPPNATQSTASKPEQRQRARSVPKFKFRKRSHPPPKNNSPNNNGHYYNGGKPIKNNQNFSYNHHNNNNGYINNNNNGYTNTNNNQKNSHFYGDKPKIIKHSRKPLGIPTPNTHINTYFHDYQKSRQDNGYSSQNSFNTRDFFTPPSVNNRYMEGIFNQNHTSKPNIKHFNFPTNDSKGKNNRKPNAGNRLPVPRTKQTSQGLVLSHHSPGKYIPPNARSYFTGHHPNVPDISTVLKTPTYHEDHSHSDLVNKNDSNGGGVDLDDVLFTLEENEHDLPLSDINNLSLYEPQVSSHGTDLHERTGSDYPDLLKSPEPAKTNINVTENPFGSQLLDGGANGKNHTAAAQHRKSVASEHKYKPGVYVPPHHRKSSTSSTSANEATLSIMNNSFNYSTSFGSKYAPANAGQSMNYQAPFLSSMKNHSTTTTALQDKDVFAYTDNDAILFSEDENDIDDFQDGKTMFGPYEIHDYNGASYGKLRAGRKSSTIHDEAVGSLEQYKNNWLMLQQQQD